MKSLTPTDLADFERLEKVVEKGQKTFVEVGDALTEIRDRKLYKKDFDTFEVYCQERWGWSRQRGSQLILAAAVVHSLPAKLSTAVDSEAVARELKKLPVPVRKEIVTEAKKSGEPLTAADVKKHLPPVPTKPIPIPVKSEPPEKTVHIPIKSAPVPQKPVEVLDKTGWPISEKLLPIWERSGEVQELLSAISKVKGALRKAQDDKDKLFAEVSFSSALAHLDQAFTDIKTAMPYAVCPTCQGKSASSCVLCKGRGFLSQFKWDTVVPRETKEIRKKAQSK